MKKILLVFLMGLVVGFLSNGIRSWSSDCGSSSDGTSPGVFDPNGSIINHPDGSQDYCFSSGDYNYCQKE